MDAVKKIIVKMLIQNDYNNFIFDEKEMKHRNQDFINSFFRTVQKEIQKKLNKHVEDN